MYDQDLKFYIVSVILKFSQQLTIQVRYQGKRSTRNKEKKVWVDTQYEFLSLCMCIKLISRH